MATGPCAVGSEGCTGVCQVGRTRAQPPDAAGHEHRGRARNKRAWLLMLGDMLAAVPTGDRAVHPVRHPAAGTEHVPSPILSPGSAAWPSGTPIQLPPDAKRCGQRPRPARPP